MSDYTLSKDSDAASTPRRVALIRREVSARLLEDQVQEVTTAPHLLLREIILVQVLVIVLALLALLFNAPLEGIANPDQTPNPAKASWYFLGLQELLHYFPPVVAGVLLPALVVIGLVLIPYVRVNWETIGFYQQEWKSRLTMISSGVAVMTVILVWFEAWPVIIPTLLIYLLLLLPATPFCPGALRRRFVHVSLADWIMTWFVTVAVTLTLIGILFRGPGWAWVWPWRTGIY